MWTDLITAVNVEAVIGISLLVILLVGLIRAVNDPDSPVEWWHFFSSGGRDGKQYGDVNKLGILVGIIGSTAIVCWLAYMISLDWQIFGLWLLFVAGVEAFGKWLRGLLDKRFTGDKTKDEPLPPEPSKSTSKDPLKKEK